MGSISDTCSDVFAYTNKSITELENCEKANRTCQTYVKLTKTGHTLKTIDRHILEAKDKNGVIKCTLIAKIILMTQTPYILRNIATNIQIKT